MNHLNNDQTRGVFRSSLQLLVLSILTDGPRHGYSLQKTLFTLGGDTVGPGTLYPLLKTLADAGWVSVETQTHQGRARKVYRITPSGEHRLRQSAIAWQAQIARLQSLVMPALRKVAGKAARTPPLAPDEPLSLRTEPL